MVKKEALQFQSDPGHSSSTTQQVKIPAADSSSKGKYLRFTGTAVVIVPNMVAIK